MVGAWVLEIDNPTLGSLACKGINKIYTLNTITKVAKLLQHSGSRIVHWDGFSLHK